MYDGRVKGTYRTALFRYSFLWLSAEDCLANAMCVCVTHTAQSNIRGPGYYRKVNTFESLN